MSLKEIWKVIEETKAIQKVNAQRIGALGEKVGDSGNKFGSFTAGLLAPSVSRVLQESFGADRVYQHLWITRKGENQDFDLLGVSNGKKNQVILAEIKSKLTEGELKKFEKKFEDFFRFMPEHRGKTLMGLLAAVDFPESMPRRVASRGFYLMQSDAKSFALLPNGKDFRPRTLKD